MANILIVEDDPVFSELLQMHLEDLGHEPVLAPDLKTAERLYAETAPAAILLDQQLPDGLGVEFLESLARHPPFPPVIMITGVSANAVAIRAMRAGAYDFVRKPLDEMELDTTLANALRTHRLSRQVEAVTEAPEYRVELGEIVGQGSAILEVCKTVGKVAGSNAPVLITGETGTGKEVVARAIHHHSGREGLFLPINCSALAENLLESELFGHEKGSFTGAERAKEGKFELAADGTLFLDEVGDMPVALQVKLLRVLQEGTFERVGGTRTLRSNTRIVAATNRDLEAMVAKGEFREDLFYRLNVVRLRLPPLRERREDLPLLVEHLLARINVRQHTRIRHLTDSAWRCIEAYPWPGNVRELENVLTRAAVLARDDTITPDLLALPQAAVPGGTGPMLGGPRLRSLEDVEREHVREILDYTHWHKGRTCEILGISRPALDRKIGKYGLKPESGP